MNQTLDVVLAGTKPFALALFAPLTERTGTRPRIAPDPAQALALCGASSGLLVVEYGPAWLPALTQLRRQAAGLRIVAALPRGLEGAALVLEPLGIDVVPWEGQPAAAIAGVERALGGAPAPRPASPPAAPRPAVTPIAGTPRVASPPPAAAPLPVPPPAAAPPPAAPPPVVGEPLDLFADLGGSAATPAPGAAAAVDPFAPPHADPFAPAAGGPLAAAPPPYTGPPAAEAPPGKDWPATAPGEDEAEAALVLHLRGKLGAEAPLAAVTRHAAAAMSELERQAVAGAAVPFDSKPIYRAAVLRLRVAAALAAAPPPPARVDEGAVQRLLGELDAVLAQVNPLAQGAPPDLQPQLEAVRNALVREAVDFSEAAHRITAGGSPPVEQASRPAAREQAPAARVLSVRAGEDLDEPPDKKRRLQVAFLVLVALLGGAYHLHAFLTRPVAAPPATFEGAPAGTHAVVTPGGQFLVAQAGKRVDPAELERFRRQEEKKGNVVRELVPGRWIIEPTRPAPAGGTP